MSEFSPALLREAMTLAGLTAAELAERAGIHRVTVANYARGLSCPADTWAKVERALRDALDERVRAITKVRKKLAA